MKLNFVKLITLVSVCLAGDCHAVVLKKHSFSFSTYGGVAISNFQSEVKFKQNFKFANSTLVSQKLLKLSGDSQKSFSFNNMYKVPFVLGCDIGYALMDNIEVIAGVNYFSAQGDNITARNVRYEFSKQKYYAGYVGGRYYFPIKLLNIQNLYHYVGAKIGYAKRNAQSMSNTTDGLAILKGHQVFSSSKGILFGAHFGAGYKLTDHFAINVTGEFLWMGGLDGNNKQITIKPNTNTTYTANIAKRPEASFHYPMTAGIRITV
jgi:hypothetical protein